MSRGLLGPLRRLLLLVDRDVRRVFTKERTDEGADRAHSPIDVEDEVGETLNQRDARLVSYACDRANPPEKQAVVLKPRTELYQFIEWLVMIRLCDGTEKNVESVIRALRSLPWDTNEASLIAKFVLKLARSKADAVPLAADFGWFPSVPAGGDG